MSGEYAELDCMSNFSFLEGASHPEELVARAAALKHIAIGIADRGTLSGVVRAHVAAREQGIPLAVGARLDISLGDTWAGASGVAGAAEPGGESQEHSSWFSTLEILAYATNRASYGRLSRLITQGRTTPEPSASHAHSLDRGQWHLSLHQLLALAQDLQLIVIPPAGFAMFSSRFQETLEGLRRMVGRDHLSLAVARLYEPDEELRVRRLMMLGQQVDIPLVATNSVRYHDVSRRRLQDVLTAARHRCTVAQCGLVLRANAECHLKGSAQMEALLGRIGSGHGAGNRESCLERACHIARECSAFSLSELRWKYPHEVVPAGCTPMQHLRALVEEGASLRFAGGMNAKVRAQCEHEFSIIADLAYEPYFLTVHDIVRFARTRGILCQGRGAAANSAICFCLGVTAVDPTRVDMLFERFISRERNEPPDIDIDFEHERREEVIQYIYRRYGRERAALTAEVVCFRGRLAVREVGKALGMSLDAVERIANHVGHWYGVDALVATTPDTMDMPDPVNSQATLLERICEAGFDSDNSTIRTLADLAGQLMGFPRHLSQHVGGFVISEDPLCEIVPVRDASMEGRSIIEWDKDDIEAMGMLKVDVLALGMLTAVRKAIDLANQRGGSQQLALHTIPPEDPQVYDMLCQADTVGVFQIESRAQMSMLPRLRPRCFYDLVIEVAIVRPGPIQGDMVHPYLRRRRGEESVTFPDERVARVLAKTLGVPLFQEQAMQLAIIAAGFTAGEADELRRAIASWKRSGSQIARFGERLIAGMAARGYSRQFADQVFTQIQGFSGYGFPESHAASFALIVYSSAWLKRHKPAEFCAALLNSQPMGFYAPAQLVRDAQEHGVVVLAPDVNHSDWDCTLEPKQGSSADDGSKAAVRLGLRLVRGLRRDDALSIEAARREHGRFTDVEHLAQVCGMSRAVMRRLAQADCMQSMSLDRQQSLWRARALDDEQGSLWHTEPPCRDEGAEISRVGTQAEKNAPVPLPPFAPMEKVLFDYRATGLSIKGHPMSFVRTQLARGGVKPCASIRDREAIPDGASAMIAGIVLVRQRPMTAKGVVFITIEDESGSANLIVRPRVYQRFRAAARHGVVLRVQGRVERHEGVCHLLARRIVCIDGPVAEAANSARNFH